MKDHEKIVKATEYVEHTKVGALVKSYVVLDTEAGNSMVIEKAAVGVAPWTENPSDLDDRNSLAKVIRSKDCRNSGKTVGALKSFDVEKVSEHCSSSRLAQAVYCYATSEAESIRFSSGFRPSTHRWS